MPARTKDPTQSSDETAETEGLDRAADAVEHGAADESGSWFEPIEDSVLEVEPDSYFGEGSATLGDRIAAARQAAGLTQAGLAARLGVGAKVVSTWENDRSEPRSNRLAMLAGLLNVSVSWLLTGGGEGVAPPETAGAAAPSDAPRPVWIALAVADLDATTRFYGDLLGGAMVAGPAHAVEADDAAESRHFSLFGHRVAATAADGAAASPLALTIDLGWDEWSAFAARLRAEGAAFDIEPEIRRLGAPAEHAVLRLADPDGNRVSFVALKHPDGAPFDIAGDEA